MLKNTLAHAVACLVFALPTALHAAKPMTVTLRDHLGFARTQELVHYDLTFKPGDGPTGAVAKVTDGNGATVTCQVSDVSRDAKSGTVTAMTVWFLADVPKDGSNSYTITPGVNGGGEPRVQVQHADGKLWLKTIGKPAVGIALPADDESHAWPAPAADVAGPIVSLMTSSGKTIGKGRLDVPFTVKARRTEVTATGPLFAEATVHYTFDTGYWSFTARVLAGSEVIFIDESLDTGISDATADAFDRFFTFILTDGGFAPTQVHFGGRNDRPQLEDLLKFGMKEEWKATGVRANWFASPVHGYTLSTDTPDTHFHLTGYPSNVPGLACTMRASQPGADAVGLMGLHTAKWRNPLSIRVGVTPQHEFAFQLPLQSYEQSWQSDGFGRRSPNYTGITLFSPPTLAKRSWGIVLTPARDETKAMLDDMFALSARHHALALDTIKDWTLDWPDPAADGTFADEPTEVGEKALKILRDRIAFKRTFGHLGRFSMAYHYGYAKGEHGAVAAALASPEKVSREQRAELRRLAAWNAYDMHQVDTFPWGTGFHLNNPNMSIMAAEARAKSSVVIRDHPQFKAWGEWTLAFMRNYVDRYTRESGATYENPHYTLGVTLGWSALVNDILVDNGIGDAFDTPRFKRSVQFVMDWLTPPDLRFNGHRVIVPIGNGSYQSVPPATATAFINYYKTRDPKLASQFQWYANQTLADQHKVHIVDNESPPSLTSKHYEDYGVSFRHGFGTEHETYFLLFAGNCDGHFEWEQDQLTYTYYAKGHPINLHFGNGYFPMFCRPWTRNRVSIGHMYEVSERNETKVVAATFNKHTEYARAQRDVDQLQPIVGEYPDLKAGRWTPEENQRNWSSDARKNVQNIPMTRWYRQVLFVKDADPEGPNYFVIRDDFGGTPTLPTDASFWFLANSMQRDGNVFHFDGQVKVDMDVFVHTPAKPDPHTDTYGHVQQPYQRLTGFDPAYHPDGKRAENQLLLRLKQEPGDGYMVVLYPRLKDIDPPAEYERLADSVVKVTTPLSTDYVMLASYPFTFKNDQFAFSGMAGSVRYYKDGRIAVANSEGTASVTIGATTIEGSGGFVVEIKDGKVVSTTKAEPTAVVKVK